MARRRFELSDGRSHKFWQIEVVGTCVRTTFGKIGSAGQIKLKDFENHGLAIAAAEVMVEKKLEEGYSSTTSPPAGSAKSVASVKPAKSAKPITSQRLATAIERCKTWMKANGAAVLVENLAKPANATALAKAAKQLGCSLPAELEILWKLHDGQRKELNGFVGSLDLLGTGDAPIIQKDVLPFYEWMMEDPDMVREAGLTTDEQNEQWIPFGTRDSDHLVVHARTGRVFTVAKDAPPFALAAKSLTAFFEDYASRMEHGECYVEEGFGDVFVAG